MCCDKENSLRAEGNQDSSANASRIIAPSSSNCPDFPTNSPCNGDLVIQCYNQTGCFNGRQLSNVVSMNLGTDYYVQYKVLAISDSNGLYYNVPSQPPTDLNISFYQDNFGDVDFQLCGAGGYNQYNSTILAGGQYIWFCQNQSYYIGVNSGDNANIPTTQFYVCLEFSMTEPSSKENRLTIQQYGACRQHACNKSSGK